MKNYQSIPVSLQQVYSKREADEMLRENPKELVSQIKYYYDPTFDEDDRGVQDAIDECIDTMLDYYEFDNDIDRTESQKEFNEVMNEKDRLHSLYDILD